MTSRLWKTIFTKKTNKMSSNGFSLIELVLVMGMFGILSLATVSMMTSGLKASKNTTSHFELNYLIQDLRETLSDPQACTYSLGNANPRIASPIANIYEKDGSTRFSAGSVVGHNALRIDSITLNPYPFTSPESFSSGRSNLTIHVSKMGEVLGARNLVRSIPISMQLIQTTPGASTWRIATCSSNSEDTQTFNAVISANLCHENLTSCPSSDFESGQKSKFSCAVKGPFSVRSGGFGAGYISEYWQPYASDFPCRGATAQTEGYFTDSALQTSGAQDIYSVFSCCPKLTPAGQTCHQSISSCNSNEFELTQKTIYQCEVRAYNDNQNLLGAPNFAEVQSFSASIPCLGADSTTSGSYTRVYPANTNPNFPSNFHVSGIQTIRVERTCCKVVSPP